MNSQQFGYVPTGIIVQLTWILVYFNPQTLGDILCSFIPFSTTTAILANSLTLVCIALDRYIAIGNVLKGSWNPSTLFCVSCAVLVWGLAAGIASPMLTSYYLVDFYIILTDPKNHTIQLDVKLASTCISDKVSMVML